MPYMVPIFDTDTMNLTSAGFYLGKMTNVPSTFELRDNCTNVGQFRQMTSGYILGLHRFFLLLNQSSQTCLTIQRSLKTKSMIIKD